RLIQDGVRVVAVDIAATRMIFAINTEAGRRLGVATRLAQFPSIDHVHLTTGAFDLLVDASFDSDVEAMDFLAREIERMDGIRQVQSGHLMKDLKANGRDGAQLRGPGAIGMAIDRFVAQADHLAVKE